MRYALPTITLMLLLLPLPAGAIPAITCHCFTDRSYDPARPALADPYFLATTQNSFFAEVFGVDKKSLVMKKQQGAASDDLWIAYWVGSKMGMSPESLLKARQERGQWKDVLAPLRPSAKVVGTRFAALLNGKGSQPLLAEAVVDELFRSRQLLPDKELAALRQAGASNQEVILATVIAARTRQPARQIYLGVKNGSRTWGAHLQGAKIDTKNMQQEVADLLHLGPTQGGR